MQAVFPPALRAGDRVGVAALSGPVASDALAAGLDALRGMGLDPVVGTNLGSDAGLFAGKDSERVEAFNALVADPDLKAIFFARGGHGILRVLGQLDWKSLERTPRAYVGYSDATPLLNLIVDRLGLVTFHGPMVAVECAQGLEELEERSLENLLFGDRSFELAFESQVQGECETVEGVLKGGCLSLLAATQGTEYSTSLADAVMFWEDVAEPLFRIDRMLTQLRLSGSLSSIKAMVSGRTELLDDGPLAGGLPDLLKEIGQKHSIPVGWDLASGHCRPNLTLPIGARVEVEAARGILRGCI